jgi:RNA polymerase sigma-70 factor (ECF subfamily)
MAAIMERDNPTWLADLSGTGPLQEAALVDLRAAMVRGLRRAIPHRARAGDAFLEDVAQDALVRILERLPQFEGRSRFLTWAMSVAVHVAMSEQRHRRWKDVSLEDVTADGGLVPKQAIVDEPNPESRWQRKAILETMYELIQNDLTEKQREALLAELRGVPQAEIAQRLGSTRNALYKLTHDARKRLKRGLEAAGFSAQDVRAAFSE